MQKKKQKTTLTEKHKQDLGALVPNSTNHPERAKTYNETQVTTIYSYKIIRPKN